MKYLKILLAVFTTITVITSCVENKNENSTKPNNTTNIEANNITNTEQKINQNIKKSLVRISGQNPGTGFIYSKKGQKYYVLTSKHVIKNPDEYEIITSDGERYKIDPKDHKTKVQKILNFDLAIVEFKSNKKYSPVELSNSEKLEEGEKIYVIGYPNSKKSNSKLNISKGIVISNNTSGDYLKDGYSLIYDNSTSPGMSGGAIINIKGAIVGVHGRAELDKETFEKTGFNLGIPINVIIEKLSKQDIQLDTNIRTELISTFSDTFKKSVYPSKKEYCETLYKGIYESLKLKSPVDEKYINFRIKLKSEGKNNNYDAKYSTCNQPVKESSIIELVIEKNGIKNYVNMNHLIATTVLYEIHLLSFSSDGKYLVVYFKVRGEYEIINFFEIMPLYDNSKSFSTCKNAQFGGKYKGFKSPSEIISICSYPPDTIEIFNIKNKKTKEITQLSEYSKYENFYKSYGFIASKPKIINEHRTNN